MPKLIDQTRSDLLQSHRQDSADSSWKKWERAGREPLKKITKSAERDWADRESTRAWASSKKEFGELMHRRVAAIREKHYAELRSKNPQAEWTPYMEMLVVDEGQRDLIAIVGFSERLLAMQKHWIAVKEKNAAERAWVTTAQWKTWCFYRDQIDGRLAELPELEAHALKAKFPALESLILSASGVRVAPVVEVEEEEKADEESMPDLTAIAASLRKAMKGQA